MQEGSPQAKDVLDAGREKTTDLFQKLENLKKQNERRQSMSSEVSVSKQDPPENPTSEKPR